MTALTLAVMAPAVATGVAWLMWNEQGRLVPASWFLAAVMITCMAGGLAAGVVATVISAFLLNYVFTAPFFTLIHTKAADITGETAFLLSSLGLCWLFERLYRAQAATVAALASRDRTAGLLDSLLANAPVGLAFYDRDLNPVRANPIFRRILPEDGSELRRHLTHVRQTTEPVLDLAMHLTDGKSQRHVLVDLFPVRSPRGRLEGVGSVVRDITAQVEGEEERSLLLNRLFRLHTLTAELAVAGAGAGAGAGPGAADIVLDRAVLALLATTASILVLDPGESRLELAGSANYPSDLVKRLSSFPLDAVSPWAEAIRTGQVVTLGTHEEIAERLVPMASDFAAMEIEALAAIPLHREGRVIGVMVAGFDHPSAFDEDGLAFLVAVGSQCSNALDRARLFDAEAAALIETDDASRRLQFLVEASALLSSSFDVEANLRELAQLSVPRMTDWCSMFLAKDGSRPNLIASVHDDPMKSVLIKELYGRYPTDIGAKTGMGAVLRTGTLVHTKEVTEQTLRAIARNDEHFEMLQAIGYGSAVGAPIFLDGKVFGAISWTTMKGRVLVQDDAVLVAELANRATQAITNARLYQERAHIAETLEASLLPGILPRIPGVELATSFVAAGSATDVGGDFYDVFALGPLSEPTTEWLIVIGDVRGKGVDAASVTGTARSTIRSIAISETSPARMLDHLNEVLIRSAVEVDEPPFCTACVATVKPAHDRTHLCLAVGGHPLPYVLRANGTTEIVGRSGSLLGAFPDPVLHEVDVALGPGDALVLYTDGLSELHGESGFFDTGTFEHVLKNSVGVTAGQLADRLEQEARAFTGEELRDDLAVLVIRVAPPVEAFMIASTVLPPVATTARRARRFVISALEGLESAPLVCTAELLTNELVTNAIVHAGSAVRLRVGELARGVRISVSDQGEDMPAPRSQNEEAEGGRGLLLVEALSDRWGVDREDGGKCVWFELDYRSNLGG